MIDNFDVISNFLSFELNNFYFIQIIKRRKDNPSMDKAQSIKDRFYIYSKEDLFNLKNKIIELCTYHNARAYININPRNTEKIALECLKLIANYIALKDFNAVKNAYISACGQYAFQKNFWFVDLDEKDLDKKEKIIHYLVSNFVCEVPSKTGTHIVVKPFNPTEFYKVFPEIQLEKDGALNLIC